jgi:hypothetical protein
MEEMVMELRRRGRKTLEFSRNLLTKRRLVLILLPVSFILQPGVSIPCNICYMVLQSYGHESTIRNVDIIRHAVFS